MEQLRVSTCNWSRQAESSQNLIRYAMYVCVCVDRQPFQKILNEWTAALNGVQRMNISPLSVADIA